MSSVLIVTPYGLHNYGNRLQNLALTRAFEKRGFDCSTLIFSQGKPFKHRAKEFAKPVLWGSFNPSIKARKYRAFRSFDKAMRKVKATSAEQLRKLGDDADVICIGSDQIWNPYHVKDVEFQFAEFADPAKKISYAASFGISEIPEACTNQFRKGLDSIRCLSVRERQGASIIERLTGRDSFVAVDPVLLLSKEEWSEQGRDRLVPSKPYVFSYFLGKGADGDKGLVRAYCEENGYELVELMSLDAPEYYVAGPRDFISLIENSSLVCTNSYHATLFSILFGRRLNVFTRIDPDQPSMFSRISNLVHEYGLGECCVTEVDETLAPNPEYVAKVLSERIGESERYLDAALEEVTFLE